MRFPEFFESGALIAPVGEPVLAPSNPGDAHAAPWLTEPLVVGANETVTVIETADDAGAAGASTFNVESQDWGESGYEARGADAIAYYVPWHISPSKWGIYFLQRPFFAFASLHTFASRWLERNSRM